MKYFEEILDNMPPAPPGHTKWVCGALFHVDPFHASLHDVCPQCGTPCHPATGYMKARDGGTNDNG